MEANNVLKDITNIVEQDPVEENTIFTGSNITLHNDMRNNEYHGRQNENLPPA